MFTIKVVHEVRWCPNDVETKLNAIIEMLRRQSGVPAELALVKDELGIIHGLLTGAVQADVDKLADEINASSDEVEAELNNRQDKGES